MKFFTRAGMVFFASDCPGEHAMLTLNGEPLPFRGDASSFDDAKRSYEWAFDHLTPIRLDSQFVFSTNAYRVVGSFRGGEICVVDGDAPVEIIDLVPTAPMVDPSPLPSSSPVSSPVLVPYCPVRRDKHLPKVSIVTATYNRPIYLRLAVESLRKQTDPDWEHLIYDDGSTDRAMKDVLAWAAEDRRVRVFYGTNINRPSVRWNYLLDRARGCYLGVLDDDNEKLPRFVEAMAGELDADVTLDLVSCGFLVHDEAEDVKEPNSAMDAAHKPRLDEHHMNLVTTAGRLVEGSTCDGGAVLFRRETFERAGYFSEAIRTNEDWHWLRRALHTSKIKNLFECLSTYRRHGKNRMRTHLDLGHDRDVEIVRQQVLRATYGVHLVRPPKERLTESQQDACSSVERGLATTPWIVEGDDLTILFSPFQLTDAEVIEASRGRRVVSLHIEDPYALHTNRDRVRRMASVASEVWVATNDVSAMIRYRDLVGDRVIVCPSLGADDTIEVSPGDRRIDVLLCGYAYPSRKKFMKELLPLLNGLKVVIVGDGWEGVSAWHLPTQDLSMTYALHVRAKTVVCLHRVHGDCADGPMEPVTVNRGFMEGYSGARVFLDRTRDAHSFVDGDVVWYDAPKDLAKSIRSYLGESESLAAERFAETCRMVYTYRTRVARMINCIRAPRFLAEVP